MNKDVPVLFSEKDMCCACSACMNACPVKAIHMSEDEAGFYYPKIDEEKCLRCGKCKSVCAYQNSKVKNTPLDVFAGVTTKEGVLVNSSSGGIFGDLAEEVIADGGYVVGAELTGDFSVRHTVINNKNDVYKLQGSKYCQSSIGYLYSVVKELLLKGNKVLFSGTPCQVDGLYGFIGQDYKNLYTVDIVCHGVPSNKMFKDYIDFIKKDKDISEFKFRDKKYGWGIKSSLVIGGKKKRVWTSESAYLSYFTMGWLYRDCCYSCKYASRNRPADLTLGDYWGIEKEHPEYIGKHGWDDSKGISLIMVNSDKGRSLLLIYGKQIDIKKTTYEKVAERNNQLRQPTKRGERDSVVTLYSAEGWGAIEKRYASKMGIRRIKSRIKALVPRILMKRMKELR